MCQQKCFLSFFASIGSFFSAKSEDCRSPRNTGPEREHYCFELYGESSSIINTLVSNKLDGNKLLSVIQIYSVSCPFHILLFGTIFLRISVFILKYFGWATCRYHNSTVINSDFQRGGINLENEKTADGTTSRLLLTRATFRDAGNYTCVPSSPLSGAISAIPDSILVHVTNSNGRL